MNNNNTTTCPRCGYANDNIYIDHYKCCEYCGLSMRKGDITYQEYLVEEARRNGHITYEYFMNNTTLDNITNQEYLDDVARRNGHITYEDFMNNINLR